MIRLLTYLILLCSSAALLAQQSHTRMVDNKSYELSNHLGNVLEVTNDRKVAKNTEAEIVAFNDYYPYGMLMGGRHGRKYANKFRYGFNGMEKDDEVYGQKGNSYTTYYRQSDVRIGRWLSVDPRGREMPWQSSFTSMDNNPMIYTDPLGDKIKYGPEGKGKAKRKKRREVRRDVRLQKRNNQAFRADLRRMRRSNDIYSFQKHENNDRVDNQRNVVPIGVGNSYNPNAFRAGGNGRVDANNVPVARSTDGNPNDNKQEYFILSYRMPSFEQVSVRVGQESKSSRKIEYTSNRYIGNVSIGINGWTSNRATNISGRQIQPIQARVTISANDVTLFQGMVDFSDGNPLTQWSMRQFLNVNIAAETQIRVVLDYPALGTAGQQKNGKRRGGGWISNPSRVVVTVMGQ